MSALMPRRETTVDYRYADDPLAPALPREVQRAIDRESARGLVAAARAQAEGFATSAQIGAVAYATHEALSAYAFIRAHERAIASQDLVTAEEVAGYRHDFNNISRALIWHLAERFSR